MTLEDANRQTALPQEPVIWGVHEVAKTAGNLTVFHHTPNWCAPSHDSTIA